MVSFWLQREMNMAKKRKTSNHGPLIYVGPGFRNSRLTTFGIFADGVPREFQGTIFAKLFVPAARLNKARADIAHKGTALHEFYQQAIEAHKKEEK